MAVDSHAPLASAELQAASRTGGAAIPQSRVHLAVSGALAAGALAAARISGLLLTCAYVVALASLHSFPLQDMPNHLARAAVLDDLLIHGGAHFGGIFEFHLLLIPYLLGDALLVVLLELFGARWAACVWIVLTLLSLPAALLFYLRVNCIRPQIRVLALVLSLVLATDWFFVTALSEFRFAVALIVLCMGLADRLRAAPSTGAWVVYGLVLLAGYFVHLATPVFLLPVLGISGLLRLRARATRLPVEFALLVPVVGVLTWHYGFAAAGQDPRDLPLYHWWWGTLAGKLDRLLQGNFDLTRYGVRGTRYLMLLLALYLAWLGVRGRRAWCHPRVLEMAALLLAFVAIYLLLPNMYSEAAYVDVRALALIPVFALLAAVWLADRGLPDGAGVLAGPIALPGALLIAAANLALVFVPMQRDDRLATAYRALASSVPARAWVLPVFTRAPQGTVHSFLQMGSWVVTDRKAVSPYLFAGDRGAPVKYFRYVDRVYVPPEWWYEPAYVPTGNVMVNWRAIGCQYDYLLLTQPWEPAWIGVATRRVAENEGGVLLRVDRAALACRADERRGVRPAQAGRAS